MNIFYWFELIALVYIVWKNKVSSMKLLKIALWGTAVGAVFSVLSQAFLAENILRIFFVFWIVGIIITLIELRNEQK